MGDRANRYASLHRLAETIAICLFVVLSIGCAWRLTGAAPAWAFAFAALAAWLATDFFSGLVHWAGDTWGDAQTPYVGAWFIRPFREHHDDPRAMTKHDFVETNGSSAIAGLPLLIVALATPVDGPLHASMAAFLFFLALGGLIANQCHKWAHMKDAECPQLVRLAQRARLILRPETHRRHHARPHDSYYCTANGWTNLPLENMGFFRGTERLLAWLGQAQARRDR